MGQDVHGFNFEKETDENAQRLRSFLADTRCVCVCAPGRGSPSSASELSHTYQRRRNSCDQNSTRHSVKEQIYESKLSVGWAPRQGPLR